MHRRVQSSVLWLLAAGAAACNEPPSFRARWSVIDRDGIERATIAPLVCTSLGINTVRVRVIDELGGVADDSYHACFAAGFDDPDETQDGPTLDAGRYAVEVRGVQRNLQPWPVPLAKGDAPLTECNLEKVACDPRDIACDCTEFEAVDEHIERLVDFLLSAPDECIDGIDNDRDGLLDAADPSCGLVTPGHEGNPVSKVQFRVALTLLGGNDVVTCAAVGLSDLRARLCPRVAGEAPAECADAPEAAALPCRVGEPSFFEQTLTEGEYTLEIVGRDQATPRTTAKLFPVTVSAGAGAFVPVELDFAATDFDPAIEAGAGFVLEFADAASSGGSRQCAPPPGEAGVTIADVVLEVLDAHGGPLPAPVDLSDDGTEPPGTPLDGAALDGTPIACPNATVVTESLVWGGYSLRVSARAADGTVCFSTDGTGPGGADAPLLLAPTTLTLVVPAVLDASGAPPASCVE